MAIISQVNQYRGVNAHYQSAVQNGEDWQDFHNQFINMLAQAIDAVLPDGYVVGVNRSLQIRRTWPDDTQKVELIKPDLLVYGQRLSTSLPSQTPPDEATKTLVQTLPATIEHIDDLYSIAVIIYKVDAPQRQPITRIELLSPSNKAGGSGVEQYIEKRFTTLKAGVRLVEIDLMHESQSPIRGLPHYPQADTSFPYTITINDPTPSFEQGRAVTYGFYVDDSFPNVLIPLDNTSITVDWGAVYNATFSSLKIYWQAVDYARVPEHMTRYSVPDQHRIIRRMQTVQAAYERGDDLTQAPLPISNAGEQT